MTAAPRTAAAPPLVEVRDLVVAYGSGAGAVRALDGVSLRLAAGETLGLVGESGSGKSTLGMALGRLLASNARFEAGSICIDGQSLLDCAPSALRRIRSQHLGFVFQNPMSALDPTMRIGRQLADAMVDGRDPLPAEVWLERVGLEQPARVAASFPHEISGGMAQRVVIAMAMLRQPALLIADEPTASLDASIQGLILDLMDRLRRENGAAMILMSHDLRLVARRCERVAVMYGGRLVEAGPSREVFERPQHPYTQALIRAAAGNEVPGVRLVPIAGVPPVLHGASAECAFAPRCERAQPRCGAERPVTRSLDGRIVACHFAGASVEAGAQSAVDRPAETLR
jgi:oligopeptide/dipeptide ABC transporter ATP-binding protein